MALVEETDSIASFVDRKDLQKHLASSVFEALLQSPKTSTLTDYSTGRVELTPKMFLVVAIALSRKWKKTIPEKRVGVVLPSGIGGALANLGLVLLGKTPVNLNFTSGRAALESSIKTAGLKTIITAAPVIEKLDDFPWTDKLIDLAEEKKNLSKLKVLGILAALKLLRKNYLMNFWDIPKYGSDKEASILFSSGSTGEPKGIILSHKNILSNCKQVMESNLIREEDGILSNLPIFHSFGFTICMWLPMLCGVRTVMLPSPLEVKKTATVIAKEKLTILIGTPTFLRSYLGKVKADQLKSLRIVVAGAEKTPDGFADKWEEFTDSEYIEGYGLTEMSPVVSVNVPERGCGEKNLKRAGSVGKLFKGIEARIVNDVTGQVLKNTERGILQLKGPNLFTGYLNDSAATEAVMVDSWYNTGDIARFDEDNFLYIEGRASRFSKIAGEMIPHGRIEEKIVDAFELDEEDGPLIAVTGVSNENKGESLVLLTSVELSRKAIAKKLVEEGLPNLWVPKVIKKVDHIPCLGSGKLDLRQISKLAASKT